MLPPRKEGKSKPKAVPMKDGRTLTFSPLMETPPSSDVDGTRSEALDPERAGQAMEMVEKTKSAQNMGMLQYAESEAALKQRTTNATLP